MTERRNGLAARSPRVPDVAVALQQLEGLVRQDMVQRRTARICNVVCFKRVCREMKL